MIVLIKPDDLFGIVGSHNRLIHFAEAFLFRKSTSDVSAGTPHRASRSTRGEPALDWMSIADAIIVRAVTVPIPSLMLVIEHYGINRMRCSLSLLHTARSFLRMQPPP